MTLAFILLFSAAASAAVFTNSTSTLAPSLQTITSTPTPTPTGSPCCYLKPQFVGLGQWYNQSVTATVATVITQYLQYNNTIVTTSTTYQNASATDAKNLGLSPFLLDNDIYGLTTAVIGTSTNMVGLPLVSPTPFYVVFDVEYGTGIIETQDGRPWCSSSTSGSGLIFKSSFIYLPTTAPWYTRRQGVTMGQDFLGTLESELAELGTTISGLESCTLRIGEGAPRIHVPVSALTEHSSTTMKMQGAPPNAVVTPAPQPPPPAQETTSPSDPAPIETNDPSTDRPGNTDAEPEPSNGDAPPAPTGRPRPSAVTLDIPLPMPTRTPELAPSLTIGTTVVPVSSAGTKNQGAVVIGDATLFPSSAVTFLDRTFSLGPSGTNLVVLDSAGPSTLPLFAPGPAPAPAATGAPQPAKSILLGTDAVPISHPSNTKEGVVLPGGTTLAPGSVVTFQGQTLSLQSGGSSLVVVASGTTSAIALYTPASANAASETVINVGSSPYTVAYATASGGGVVLSDGKTLLPGSQTTVDGTVVSLGTQGTELVVGSSTVALSSPQTAAASGTVIKIGSSSYTIAYPTASGGGVVLPGSQTLLPGSTTVIDGTTLSLVSGGTELVVGSTAPLQSPKSTRVSVSTTGADATTTEDIGSGLGGGSPTSTPAASAVSTGGSNARLDNYRSVGSFVAAAIAVFELMR